VVGPLVLGPILGSMQKGQAGLCMLLESAPGMLPYLAWVAAVVVALIAVGGFTIIVWGALHGWVPLQTGTASHSICRGRVLTLLPIRQPARCRLSVGG
jgi:hypothetical protein